MDPKLSPIATGEKIAIVQAAAANECRRKGTTPKGGERGEVVAYVAAGTTLDKALTGTGVDRKELKGYADPSERDRYVVRIPRVNKKGLKLQPAYKVPLAGNVVLANPAQDKPVKKGKASAASTASAASAASANQERTESVVNAVSGGLAVGTKRGKGA